MRFELMTSSLPRRRSTPELRGRQALVHPSSSYILSIWSGRRDSNSRPSAWKADALPTELHPPTKFRNADFKLRIYYLRRNSEIRIPKSEILLVQGVGFEPT